MIHDALKLFVLPNQLRAFGGLSGIRDVLGYGFEIWMQPMKVGEESELLADIDEPKVTD